MAFEQTDTVMNEKFKEIKSTQPSFVELSGCTGSVLLVQEDYFVVANAGDSPIIVFRDEDEGTKDSEQDKRLAKFKAEQLSIDHKPDMEEERERILKSEGVLDQFESATTGKKIGPMRVWSKNVRQPGLAMSRSLGDNLAHQCGVVSTPYVKIIPRDRKRDRAILLCSDGISDQVSLREMEDTITFFYRSQDTENCCKQLVESATQKWHTKHNMQDDITAIVIFLR